MAKTERPIRSPQFAEIKGGFRYFSFLKQKSAAVIIFILGVLFYAPSIDGEYALDDGIIIHQNDHVLKGFDGIDDILTKDAYESFYRRMCATDQLAGGRYRPLSVVSFAIEQQFIRPYRSGLYMQVRDLNQNGKLDDNAVAHTSDCGRPEVNYEYNDFVDLNNNGQAEPNECPPCWDLNRNFKNETEEDLNVDGVHNEVDCQVYSAKVRHFNNIWTYGLGCVFLYLVLARYFFRNQQDLSFLAALLFTMHPIHSEAIANVKSRDEIFSLIFVSLTFLFSFKYLETKKNKDLFWASLMFLLALLSKEYAVMLFLLIPFAVYTFTENNVQKEYIHTKFFAKAMVVLTAAFLTIFIHKGVINPLLGESSKFLNLMVSLLVVVGISYWGIGEIKKKEWFRNLREFPFDSAVKNILIVALVFVLCASLMLIIKRNYDMKMPPPLKPTRAFWLFPFVYLIIVNIVMASSIKKFRFVHLMSWLGFVLLFYLGMRLVAVKLKPGVPDTEILNNPYLLANEMERFCTKTYVLWKYLRLQLFPHPLSSDYSFNTIQYRTLASWDFWFSLLLHIGILVAGVYYTIRRHILGFAIMTYVLFGLMIANILMDIGATMGERLIFHSNIGFCIAMAWFILKGLEKLSALTFNVQRAVLLSALVVIGFLYGCKAWERSKDWKNDVTLFLKDVKTMPHSVLVLGNAGARWVDLADTKEVTGRVLPGQDSTRFNDYNGTLRISEQDMKECICTNLRDMPSVALLTLNQLKTCNCKSKRDAALYKGIKFLLHAVELHPRYVNGYLNLGLAHFKLRKDFEALYYWKNAERLYPNNPYLRNYYIVYTQDLKNRGAMAFNRGRMDSAAMAYNMLTILNPNDAEGWYNLGGCYFNVQRYFEAKECWERALRINPNYTEVKRAMAMITPQILGIQPATSPTIR